jgi:hypothetical protein
MCQNSDKGQAALGYKAVSLSVMSIVGPRPARWRNLKYIDRIAHTLEQGSDSFVSHTVYTEIHYCAFAYPSIHPWSG